jgi:hypothetical protein
MPITVTQWRHAVIEPLQKRIKLLRHIFTTSFEK